MAAAARHGELWLAQRPQAIGGDHRVEFTTDLWQNAYAHLFQRSLQPLRDASADEHLDAQFRQTADDSPRLVLKQDDFPALQFGVAFETNHKQPRRHIEDGRHTALAIGNRNQHTSRNASFVPTPNYQTNNANLGVNRGELPGFEPPEPAAVRCKTPLPAGAPVAIRESRPCV